MKRELIELKGYLIEILFTLGLMALYVLVVWILTL